MTTPTDPAGTLRAAMELLSDAESYLSALHGSVARHDNLGANLTCGGCQLRDRITPALAVARQLLGTGEQADAVAAPARVGRCAVMFEGGGRCEKDADHRAGRWSDDPHTPEPTPAEETTR